MSETARKARLRLGVDYFMKVWVNGQLVYNLDHSHGAPLPNRHILEIDLRPGLNYLTLKIASGSKGFGFWANLSNAEATASAEETTPVDLYPFADRSWDPYLFTYY